MARNGEKRSRVERERYWRRMIAAWGESGLTQVEFCRRKGISVGSFWWWKSTLAARESAARMEDGSEGFALVSGEESSKDDNRVAFLPVDVVHREPEVELLPDEMKKDLVLEIGERVRIRLARGFDREVLRGVLAVLEGEGC